MSCIINIFTADKQIVSADSAVSSESRTYAGVEKIIPLSNDPPIVLSYYGNADFEGIPIANIVSEFKKNTDFSKVNTVVKVKESLLEFIHDKLKRRSLDEFINENLCIFKESLDQLNSFDLKYYSQNEFDEEILPKFEKYNFDFKYVGASVLSDIELEVFNKNMNNLFLSELSNDVSGIVISGINKNTMKNSYTAFEMICNNHDDVVISNVFEELNFSECKIRVFAQNDVIKGFFNGIDNITFEELEDYLVCNFNEAFDKTLEIIKKYVDNSEIRFEDIISEIEMVKINFISDELLKNKLHDIERKNMRIILKEIEIMPKIELINISRILINMTRLKRIFTSNRVTVDGNVLSYVLSLKEGIEKFY